MLNKYVNGFKIILQYSQTVTGFLFMFKLF